MEVVVTVGSRDGHDVGRRREGGGGRVDGLEVGMGMM